MKTTVIRRLPALTRLSGGSGQSRVGLSDASHLYSCSDQPAQASILTRVIVKGTLAKQADEPAANSCCSPAADKAARTRLSSFNPQSPLPVLR